MRGDPEFDRVWAAWFAENPTVQASWRHQNGYLPMGADPHLDDFDPRYDEDADTA